jgi:hypothetical protein
MYTYQRYDHPPTANRLRQTDVLLMVSDDKSRQNDPKRVMFVVSATHAADSRVGAIWDDQNPSFALMDSLLRHAGLSFNDFPLLPLSTTPLLPESPLRSLTGAAACAFKATNTASATPACLYTDFIRIKP